MINASTNWGKLGRNNRDHLPFASCESGPVWWKNGSQWTEHINSGADQEEVALQIKPLLPRSVCLEMTLNLDAMGSGDKVSSNEATGANSHFFSWLRAIDVICDCLKNELLRLFWTASADEMSGLKDSLIHKLSVKMNIKSKAMPELDIDMPDIEENEAGTTLNLVFTFGRAFKVEDLLEFSFSFPVALCYLYLF